MNEVLPMKSSVSLLALALSACLAAGCTTAAASSDESASTASAPADAQESRAAPTVADAEAFIARAERELSEFSVVNSRAQWRSEERRVGNGGRSGTSAGGHPR